MKKLTNAIRLSFSSFKTVYLFNKVTVIFILFVLVLNSLSTYFSIYLSKIIVDTLFSSNTKLFYISLFSLLLTQIVTNYLDSVSSIKNTKMNRDFNNKIDLELIEQIERLSLSVKENPKFNADLSYLRYMKSKTYELYFQFIQLCIKILTLLMGLKLLFNVDLVFCVSALAFGIIKGLFNIRQLRRRVELDEEIQRKTVKHSYLFELMIGIKNQKELTIYRAFQHFKRKWKNEKEHFDQLCLQSEKMNSKIHRQQEAIAHMFDAMIILIFAILMKSAPLTMGEYVLVTMAVGLTISNFSIVIEQITLISQNYLHKEKFDKSTYSDIMTTEDNSKFEFKFETSIRLIDVKFSYPNTQQLALKGINLSINKGETVVILGENGSGKSTLVKVLLGLYPLQEDGVLVDGIPINDIKKESIYNKVSVVFQDFIQYHTNVRDNVAIGNMEEYQNDEFMYSVLQHVGLHFENGLETKVGFIDEGSVNLSGGQWQRLALSRFYFKQNPELAIFDEVTSALDPLTEIKVFNDIINHCKNITTLIISHRVGLARKADKIVVMEQGQIIEAGNHNELIEFKGNYYQMWISQKEWYEEEKELLAVSE